MDFPAQPCERVDILPEAEKVFGIRPLEGYAAADFLLVFENEAQVEGLEPDFRQLCQWELRGVIATAPGDNHDFVSRFFAPEYGIDEDPVTGSAFCELTPCWANRLGKAKLSARQISRRGGNVECELMGDRVKLSGTAVTYLEGQITVSIPQSILRLV